MDTEMKKSTYSPKEIAGMLGIDVSTVTRWCERGKIAAKKPVGRWVITHDSIRSIFESYGILGGE